MTSLKNARSARLDRLPPFFIQLKPERSRLSHILHYIHLINLEFKQSLDHEMPSRAQSGNWSASVASFGDN